MSPVSARTAFAVSTGLVLSGFTACQVIHHHAPAQTEYRSGHQARGAHDQAIQHAHPDIPGHQSNQHQWRGAGPEGVGDVVSERDA